MRSAIGLRHHVARPSKTDAGELAVESALHAFLDTDRDTCIEGGLGLVELRRVRRECGEHARTGANLIDQHFDPVEPRLIGLLKQALPDRLEEDIFWGDHFVMGAPGSDVVWLSRPREGICRDAPQTYARRL